MIATGGTFDKSYDEVHEVLGFSDGSIVRSLVDRVRLQSVTVVEMQLMDSLEMRSEHRRAIIQAIENSQSRCVVIVHGTSTLIDTAKALEEAFGNKRTIVLTGALRPFRYDPVEAAFNFGAAVNAARNSEGGVYVAIHGLLEPPGQIRKDADTAKFVYVSA